MLSYQDTPLGPNYVLQMVFSKMLQDCLVHGMASMFYTTFEPASTEHEKKKTLHELGPNVCLDANTMGLALVWISELSRCQ